MDLIIDLHMDLHIFLRLNDVVVDTCVIILYIIK